MKKRIHKKPSDHQNSKAPILEGLVIQRFGQHALVESSEGSLVHCALRANMEALVAGDRVTFQMENQQQGVVLSLFPRHTVLGRPNQHGIMKPIAANITQLFVVVAPIPKISWTLLDSYLIMAEYLSLSASIILNKTDLKSEALKEQLMKQYEPLGYPLFFLSQLNPKQDHPLKSTLKNQTSVFVGQSGVGKSSTISRLLECDIPTGAISERTELGTHTTTSSSLYHIPSGGDLIDSPGVREFGLWQMPIQRLAEGYREFKPYLSDCKFRDCRHIHTMGCALIHALEKKLISEQRYQSYVKIASQFAKSS